MWFARPAGIHHRRGGSGSPYLLVHGLGGEACVWEPVLEDLQRHHDVIAIDLPGFGRSPSLPDATVPTAAALAGAVAGLLDELGIDAAHVAGNSLGGWVALELALAGRALSVAGVCPAGLWGAPISTGATPVRGRAHRLARRLRPLIPVALLSARVRHAILSPFVAHPERVPYHAAWRMISSYARATAYEATSTAMRQGAFTDAARIDVPVTLAFGERDRLIRPTRLASPDARGVLLADCGHIPMWDDTPAVTELLLGSAARAQRPVLSRDGARSGPEPG
jgi:pimeloyl-ACP methyl ester carboxylesterase